MRALVILAGLACLLILAAPARGLLNDPRDPASDYLPWLRDEPQLAELLVRVGELEQTNAKLRSTVRKQRRVLRYSGRVSEAINLACTTYHVSCVTLWRKAFCETGGTFWPRSYNRSSRASGLFQFLPSTWRTTPYARFSIWSPWANALAAGWMHQRGRGGEWECR